MNKVIKNGLPKISEKEKEVMLVFWSSKESLTASAVAGKDRGLNNNTVQVAVRNLLKKGYIEVADIVYSGTVLTRSYKSIISAEQYAADQLQSMRLNTLNFSTVNLIDFLIKSDETDILDKLENIIKQKKEQEDDSE